MYRLSVCLIAAGFAVLTASVSAASRQTPAGADARFLDAEIKMVSSDADARLRKEIERTLGETSGTRATEGIRPSSLGRMGSETQRFLMDRLQRTEFAAMKDYVAIRFPRPPSPDHKDPVLGMPTVSRQAAVEYAEALAAFVKRIAANPLAVTLSITTVPADADVELRTAAVHGPRSRTNTTLKNVYRGLYKFRITKPLHKPAEGAVNLVDDDREHLDCTLALASDTHAESSCRRR